MTQIFAKSGMVNIPLQAVVGGTLTVTIPVTAICPNCAPLLEAAKAVEWAVVVFNTDGTVAYQTCPACGGPDRPDYIGPAGHLAGCQLHAAIEGRIA